MEPLFPYANGDDEKTHDDNGDGDHDYDNDYYGDYHGSNDLE